MTVVPTISQRITGYPVMEPKRSRSRLQRQLCGTVAATALLALGSFPLAAHAQTTTTTTTKGVTIETVTVRAAKRLIKQKDSPSAVTELGASDIAQVGVQGSVATLLRAAPSVYVYQSSVGNNEPVLTIRGVRGLETAETLDGVPTQDLLFGGSGAYLNGILGGYFNLDQISDVTIYKGVAYPDANTFGTIGGTVAYESERPTKDAEIDLTGSVGSFGTYNEGIELDSGKFDSGLGTGDDAASVMAKYSNEQTNGYIDHTPARYNNLEAAFDKPYDGGLSKLQGTLLYNTAHGLYDPEPVPLPYLQQNGTYSNYATDVEMNKQANQFLTIILKDDTYINDYVDVGATAFYNKADSITTNWSTTGIFTPPGTPTPYAVNEATPFLQTIDGFDEQGYYGPGSYFYDPQAYSYDGNAQFNNTKSCPASLVNEWAGQTSPCGYNAQLNTYHQHTFGIQPRVTFTPPDIFGIENIIKIGGMAAEEIAPAPQTYAWGTQDVPQTAANLVGGYDGDLTRSIFQIYGQDKISLFDDTFHITPGITWEGTHSSYWGDKIFGGTPSASDLATAYCQAGNPCLTGYYKATKWDRDYLPFLNVAYDLDKILPAAKGASLYASYGQSALFAPVGDFSPNLLGSPPNASIVHMYEGGIKYDTTKAAFNADYFYQKIDRDFGFFQYQSGPDAGEEFYDNAGQREIKGIEVSGDYKISPEWEVFGNASHQLAKYLVTTLGFVTVQEDQFGIVRKGTPVTGVPDWLSTFGVNYTHKDLMAEGDELGVRFEGQYTGHQYTSYDVNGFTNLGPIYGVGPYGSYNYYNVTAGATTYDPNGGINPFTIFNLDAHYTTPTPSLKFLREIKFDLNVGNLFGQHYWAYYYKQISPGQTYCSNVSGGNFTSGPFKGQTASNYCGPEFADGIPGEPSSVTFTVSAKF